MSDTLVVTPPAVEETGPLSPVQVEKATGGVPDKFKNADGTTNVDALIAAYAALETKQSTAKKPDEAPKDGEKPADAKPTVEKETVAEVTPEQKEVTEVLKGKGLDLSEFTAEYTKDTKLSDASYEKLAKAGFPKGMVDAYMRGLQADHTAANAAIAEVHSSVPGGKDTYDQMIAWAATGLTPAEIKAFDAIVQSGNVEQTKIAVQGIHSKYTAAEGIEPTNKVAGGEKVSADVFRSTAEVTAAMADPRYKTDAAYNADITAKLLRSNVFDKR